MHLYHVASLRHQKAIISSVVVWMELESSIVSEIGQAWENQCFKSHSLVDMDTEREREMLKQ